jgi:hypothetical protein
MIPGTKLPTPYENRLKLVQDTMTMYSVLGDYAAGKLAGTSLAGTSTTRTGIDTCEDPLSNAGYQ